MVQSYVSVKVPLYVSYAYYSPMTLEGWQHFDLTSTLRLTFVYDTTILWQNGIGTVEPTQLQGNTVRVLSICDISKSSTLRI